MMYRVTCILLVVCASQSPIAITGLGSSPATGDIPLIPEEFVNDQVKMILNHLRNNQSGIPGLDVPDPMVLPDFETDASPSVGQVYVKLTNVSVNGMSQFKIDYLQVNLVKMEFDLGISFAKLSVNGTYDMSGKVSFFSLDGNGDFWMNIINALTTGWAKLVVTDAGQVQIHDIELDLAVQGIELHFENLGKGYMARIVSSLINSLSKGIFQAIKPTILEEMKIVVQDTANEKFLEMPPQPILLTALSPLDVAVAQTAQQIRQTDLDPMNLPTHERQFEQSVFFTKVYGTAGLYNGYVTGLSTLHRSGDFIGSFANNTLCLSARLGFDMLEGGYVWKVSFMGLQKSGGLHFRIESLDLLINITLKNELGAHPVVTNLEVSNVYEIRTDVDGLGSLDFLLEFLTNLITNSFKYQLSTTIEGAIKTGIQDNLKHFKLNA